MNKINKLLKPFDIALTKVLNNRFVSLFLKVFLVLYTSLMVPKLPKQLLEILNHTVSRIVIAAIIVILATKDVTLGILSAVAFIMTIEFASHLNLFEDFVVNEKLGPLITTEIRKTRDKKEELKKKLAALDEQEKSYKQIAVHAKNVEDNKKKEQETISTVPVNMSIDKVLEGDTNNSSVNMDTTMSSDFTDPTTSSDMMMDPTTSSDMMMDPTTSSDMMMDSTSMGVPTVTTMSMGNDSSVNMNVNQVTTTTPNMGSVSDMVQKSNELQSTETFVGNKKLFETFTSVKRAVERGILTNEEASQIMKHETARFN